MRFKQESPSRKKDCTNPAARNIFDAARSLFLKNGFRSVTVRDIANLAGTNVALVSYYYNSKDHLADAVYRSLADECFNQIIENNADPALCDMDSAEKMYIYTVLSGEYASSTYSLFYYEYMQFCHENHTPSRSITQLSQEVIREYNVKISPAENEIYLTTLIGTERFLQLRKAAGEINITFAEIADVMLSNYFFNINLPDKTIASIIQNCKDYLENR